MKFEIEYRGKLYDVEWFDSTDFESLEKVRGAHGFVFDDDGKSGGLMVLFLMMTEKFLL